jgi:ATP-dependent RNA helicase HelY
MTSEKSPSERYAAAALRHAESKTVLAAFRASKDFELDDFQIDACKALESGHGVLVAAPTGAGKTVVGEFAIHLALHLKGKAFYTTPIKALSNQKFNELVETYGASRVGLLTGDVSINSEADVVVMTTEVLRNMLYVGSPTLTGLLHVVMDEVHYLADRNRGAVWEEVILHLPESVSVTALSATVSNAEEFGAWLTEVRGATTVIVEEHRPVPLWQLVAADKKLLDLFVDEEQRRINPELLRLQRDAQYKAKSERGRGNRSRFSPHTPFKDRLIRELERDGLLPAIYFIFSRKGCDTAVEECLRSGLKLTSEEERIEIRRVIDSGVADLPPDDLHALKFAQWAQALEWGVAAHHAGLIPRFKEIVETLFQRGLLKVVFATETLALGINMPARSVVIDRLTKWNGDTHVELSPGEYTQLTGRAGRRGIDDEGNAIVVWQSDLDPSSLAGLASTRTYPLRSSFKPSYTMAVNVVSNMGYARATEILGLSFAQYQANSGVLGLSQQIKKQAEALEGYLEAMTCHLGDFAEYAELRHQISNLEKEATRAGRLQLRQEAIDSISELVVGDIVLINAGRRAGPAVVIDITHDAVGDVRLVILNLNREIRKVSAHDFEGEVRPLGRIKLPRNFDSRSSKMRNDAVNLLKRSAFDPAVRSKQKSPRNADIENEISMLRASMRQHACHGCSDRDEHARWSERYYKLIRERDSIQKQIDHRTNVIARDFERICGLLTELNYMEGQQDSLSITETGALLKRIHAESELLIAESMRRGIFDGLTAAELVSAVSTVVYESRRDDDRTAKLPYGPTEVAVKSLQRLWAELTQLEARYKLSTVKRPDLGFAWPIYRWASEAKLTAVLKDSDISAGDFVRTTRRLIDVLEQIAAVADASLKNTANEAIELVRRGIVSASELED